MQGNLLYRKLASLAAASRASSLLRVGVPTVRASEFTRLVPSGARMPGSGWCSITEAAISGPPPSGPKSPAPRAVGATNIDCVIPRKGSLDMGPAEVGAAEIGVCGEDADGCGTSTGVACPLLKRAGVDGPGDEGDNGSAGVRPEYCALDDDATETGVSRRCGVVGVPGVDVTTGTTAGAGFAATRISGRSDSSSRSN